MVSGLPKVGKSSLTYLLGKSPRIHRSWVLDLGEGSADEYGDDDAAYEIVEWGRTFADLRDSIMYLIGQPCPADKMNAITVDSGTELWDGLKDRASARARNSKKNAEALKVDPDFEVDVSMPFWNDAKDTWAGIVSPLKLAPHIVGVITVTTDIVAEVGANGVPTKNRVTSYQAEKTLLRTVTAHVSVKPDHSAHLVDVRSKLIRLDTNGLRLAAENPLGNLVDLLSPTGTFTAPEVVAPIDEERTGEPANTITPEQATEIRATVATITDADVGKGVRQAFLRQFGKLDDMPASRFDEAVKWLGNRLGRYDESSICTVCGGPLAINMHADCAPPPAAKRSRKPAAPPPAEDDRGDGDEIAPEPTGLDDAVASAATS